MAGVSGPPVPVVAVAGACGPESPARPIQTPTAPRPPRAGPESHGRGAKAARRPAAARAPADAGAPSCASICGHRSRPGATDCGRSRSELTARGWFTGESVMSVNLHAEPFAQQPACTMELRFAGALGDAEHLRRLGVRIAVQRVQHQRIARAIGKPGDSRFDLLHLDRSLERPPGRQLSVVVVHGNLDRAGLAALAE